MIAPSIIKVLVVDGSPITRSILMHVLGSEGDLEVVGGAKDASEAREFVIAHRPDVIILALTLPGGDGLAFLRKLMAHYPVPVIVCGEPTPTGSNAALEALEIGATDFLAKPTEGGGRALKQLGAELVEKVRAAAVAIRRTPSVPQSAESRVPACKGVGLDAGRYVVALGASTGGTEAIKTFLTHVPADFPPVVMVQHMPEGFTRSFAQSLDKVSPLSVSEAVDGDLLVAGRAFLARGNIQMRVRLAGGRWKISYGSTELVNRHCPSVDVLFDSIAPIAGLRAVGVLLTGMGSDGAKGLLNLRRAGAITFAQDQRSCVVYGMPKAAVDIGAAQHTCSPVQMPSRIIQALHRREATPARSGV